ncbi:MAG TPA: hypothetical protein VIT92_11950 [Burkholderiaceae bacterium]
MTYRIREVSASGQVHTYPAIGDLGHIQDAAYDRGALSVTAIVVQP